jgi:restriction system protein
MSEKINSSEIVKHLEDALYKTIEQIPVLDSSVDYWLVRAQSGTYYTDFNINNYVGIDWNSVSLNDIRSANNSAVVMKNILRERLPGDIVIEPEDASNQDYIEEKEVVAPDNRPVKKVKITENQYGTWAGQLLRFVNNLKINDIVVVPSKSSEFFLVGRISGDIHELSDKDINDQETSSNYKKSTYKKRWPVEWWGYFDRSDADSALYKMIYSQSTLTNINDYRPFINRAMFPYYIQDEELHITFDVSQPSNIDSLYLGQFIYQYSTMSKLLEPENDIDVKINVQSEGIIELISGLVTAGLSVFTILSFVLVAPFGGKLKVFGQEFDLPGFVKGYQEMKAKGFENDKTQLENIKIAVEMANELKVPISQLGIKMPKDLQKSLEANLEKAINENSSASSKDETTEE